MSTEERLAALEEQVKVLAKALTALVDVAAAELAVDPFAAAFQNFRRVAAARELEAGVSPLR